MGRLGAQLRRRERHPKLLGICELVYLVRRFFLLIDRAKRTESFVRDRSPIGLTRQQW
jgi:hypothetical protein